MKATSNGTGRSRSHWYDEPASLHQLYLWICDHTAAVIPPAWVGAFLEEPWHWQSEWDDMQRHLANEHINGEA